MWSPSFCCCGYPRALVFRFIALEDLRDISADSLQALISTEKVYLLGHEDGLKRPMLSFVYKEIFCCRCIPESESAFLSTENPFESIK